MDINTIVLLWIAAAYCVMTTRRVSPSDTDSCGGLCRCNETDLSALCDGHGNNTLQFGVPPLPSFVTNLMLKSFNIQNMTRKTFAFVQSLNLTSLNINNSTIADIEEDTFSVFSHCKNLKLIIGHNVIAETVISKVLKGLRSLTLDYLDLRHLNISDRDGTFFNPLSGASVQSITVSKNYLTKYNHSQFVNVSNLSYLDLSGNDINVTTLTYSSVLRQLLLNYNRIPRFPIICRRHKSMFPNLELLKLDHNNIDYINSKQIYCLKKLKYLDLSRNFFTTIATNTFAYLPHLETIRLRNMVFDLVSIKEYAFNNSNIRSIILRDNRMELQHALHVDSFAGCDRLEDLDLSYNQVTKLPKRHEYIRDLLRRLHNLKWLSLGSLLLFEIPEIVMNLTKIEVLELYTNYISKLPDRFFSRMPKLKKLYIGTNSFSSLDRTDFPLSMRERVKVLEFSGNPFVCDCKMLWFVEWMRRTPGTFGPVSNYMCTNSDGSIKRYLMTDMHISLNFCLLSFETALIIVSLSIFVIIVLMTSSLVYKWSWNIKHCIYMLRYEKTSRNETNINYIFDAYVIYCAENRKWVLEEAIPNLEERAGISLCIHERDFMPGALIVDNIVDSLRRSRRVVLVLSNDFARSHWCQFEMCLCQTYLLEHRRGLLLAVLLEDIKPCYVTKSMYAMLKTTTYCTWPGDDRQAKDLFWQRMRQALTSA
ncbi:toll-like receptor 3 [Gigantopelta aegis]|uniref:toll-like receptor 3 n=1 Tax=Gigantopelta aegis TaxID=1735272 RepID=UPI001B888D66|nr:toll-like receptor 3 [Gigantopelta aegis]